MKKFRVVSNCILAGVLFFSACSNQRNRRLLTGNGASNATDALSTRPAASTNPNGNAGIIAPIPNPSPIPSQAPCGKPCCKSDCGNGGAGNKGIAAGRIKLADGYSMDSYGNVYDPNGKIIGKKQDGSGDVYDANGKLIGRVEYDAYVPSAEKTDLARKTEKVPAPDPDEKEKPCPECIGGIKDMGDYYLLRDGVTKVFKNCLKDPYKTGDTRFVLLANHEIDFDAKIYYLGDKKQSKPKTKLLSDCSVCYSYKNAEDACFKYDAAENYTFIHTKVKDVLNGPDRITSFDAATGVIVTDKNGKYGEDGWECPPCEAAKPADKVEPAPIVTLIEKLNNEVRTVEFRVASSELTQNGRESLERAYTILSQVLKEGTISDQKIEVVGHTSAEGSVASNLSLSNKRAATIVAFLTGKGVPADKITSTGRGEEYAAEATRLRANYNGSVPELGRGSELEGKRSQNRRVEWKFSYRTLAPK